MAFGIFIKLYTSDHIISIGNGKMLYYHYEGESPCPFENEDIVWYEISSSNPHKAENLIHIRDFKLVHRWHDLNYYPNQKLWYVPEVLEDGYYINEHEHHLQVLIVKGEDTQRIRLYGHQYYIVSFYLEYKKYSNVIDYSLFEELGKEVKKIVDSTDITKISDSISVDVKEHFIYRHGDHDDSYFVDKTYSVDSKDPYINRFLPNKQEEIVSDSGFCMAWDLKCYPDESLGRQTMEEEQLKQNFLLSYSKENHYNSLMFYKLKRYFDSQEKYNKAYLKLHEYFPTSIIKDELIHGPMNQFEVENFVLFKTKGENKKNDEQ